MSRRKDMSGVPTSVYDVSFVRNTGWPTGRESYGHGVLMVVVGVTPHRGERESLLQGEAGQAGEPGRTFSEVRRNATGDAETMGWQETDS